MDTTVVIVSWNVRRLLQRCLTSLAVERTSGSFDVIVIDNASVDGSIDMIRNEFPWVTCIQNRVNRGFAYATNQGVRQSTGRYVFILNPDTIVREGTIRTLQNHLSQHPSVAMVVPRLVNSDGSFQQGSQRRDPTFLSQLVILLKLQPFMRSSGVLKRYYWENFKYDEIQDVEQPMGAALFLRRDVLDQLGNFDERYFLWFEEVDLCYRLRRSGHRIVYLPHAVVMHTGASSFNQRLPIERQWIYDMSAIRYFSDHVGIIQATILALTVPINLMIALCQQMYTIYVRRQNR